MALGEVAGVVLAVGSVEGVEVALGEVAGVALAVGSVDGVGEGE